MFSQPTILFIHENSDRYHAIPMDLQCCTIIFWIVLGSVTLYT
jgi:hypothetical protein